MAGSMRGGVLHESPAVQMIVPTIAHCDFVTEEIVGSPSDHVRLTQSYDDSACRAKVLFVSAVGRDVPYEPLRA